MTQASFATFMAVLHQIMESGLAAVLFKEHEIFARANRDIPLAERISYSGYLEFVSMLDKYGEKYPNTIYAEQYFAIYDYMRCEFFDQRKQMSDAIKERMPDWRRFCWLLEKRNKDEKALIAAANAKAKEQQRKEHPAVAELAREMEMAQKVKSNAIAQENGEPTNEPSPTPPPMGTPMPLNTPPANTPAAAPRYTSHPEPKLIHAQLQSQPKKKFSDRFSPKTRVVG